MSKLLAILKALINGEAKIDSVDKTPIDRTPGEVTELGHNWLNARSVEIHQYSWVSGAVANGEMSVIVSCNVLFYCEDILA